MKARELPTQERLKELLDYNQETGVFVWKGVPISRRAEDGQAGSLMGIGYRSIGIDKVSYYSHRLAWRYVTGEDPGELQIDHKDGDRLNNSFNNLRVVTNQSNQHNRQRDRGYCWDKQRQKWRAKIMVNGKYKYLGRFSAESEARAAYLAAKDLYHPTHCL